MEKLFKEYLEKAIKNKLSLRMLKNSAVCVQQYELASYLRTIERERFPEKTYILKKIYKNGK